jgi:hypothetical protein
MTRARLRALLAIIVLAIGGAAVALAMMGRAPPPPPARLPAERPVLLLLTSLPLMFGEHFSLDAGGSPALAALETRYRVVPISVSDESELKKSRLLLLAHPPAQRPEDLVALDSWVRGGGRVLLLADPLLEWPSERPPGDPLRPSPMFTDTGLLAHWGLRLDAPEQRGAERRKFGGYDVSAVSPGALHGRCAISGDRLVARCRIGKGRATIVADADLLNADPGDRDSRHNLDALLAELAKLE